LSVKAICAVRRALLLGGCIGAFAALGWPHRAGAQLHAEMAAPFVASPPEVVDAMCDLAEVTARDTVVDLGSGDGRIVVEAAKRFGARGFGVDINPGLVRLANDRARQAGVDGRVHFFVGDLFQTTVSQASVVFLYLLPGAAARLVPRLYQELTPGTRVVSHDYTLEPLQAARRVELEVPEKEKITGTAHTFLYLYIVAAPARGRWSMVLPAALGGRSTFIFAQDFDRVSGYVEGDPAHVPFTGVGIAGRDLQFVVPELSGHKDVRFQLTVEDSGLEGSAGVNGIDLQVTGFLETREATP